MTFHSTLTSPTKFLPVRGHLPRGCVSGFQRRSRDTGVLPDCCLTSDTHGSGFWGARTQSAQKSLAPSSSVVTFKRERSTCVPEMHPETPAGGMAGYLGSVQTENTEGGGLRSKNTDRPAAGLVPGAGCPYSSRPTLCVCRGRTR